MKSIVIYLSLIFIVFEQLNAQNTWQYINDVEGCSINATIVFNGELYAGDRYGGSGCSVNGCASNIVKFNGSSWSCVGNNLQDAFVFAFAEFNGELYAGGKFYFINGTEANVVKLQSNNWVGVRNNTDYDAYKLCVFNNQLYELEIKGGTYSVSINKWNNISWDTVLNLYAYIDDLAPFHDELYICGRFNNISGVTANNIIRYNGTSYSDVGGPGTTTCFNRITHLYVFDNNLYASGSFDNISGVSANKIARWDGESWHPLGNGLTNVLQDPYMGGGTIYHLNSNIIASDYFIDSNNYSANRVLEWDGYNWNAISPVNHNGISSFVYYNNDLYASGSLGSYDTVLMKYSALAEIKENKIDESFSITPNPVSNYLKIQSKRLEDKRVSYYIYNIDGQKILVNENVGNDGIFENTIDVSSLSTGMYILEIFDDIHSSHIKFIKQ